ncbi:retrotransposon hot spot (RHS) protein [Trypanosoma cruzi]|nr:retrotransposon hot spot (RHS) protein [Trypanosoma cruzi]
MGDSGNASVVRSLSWRGVKGYIIYDVAEPDDEPSDDLPPRGWGMVLVTTPNEGNFKEWYNQGTTVRTVMNYPEEKDVKALCVWMKRDQPFGKQAEHWREVRVAWIGWDCFFATPLISDDLVVGLGFATVQLIR